MKTLHEILEDSERVHGGLPPYVLFMREVTVASMPEFRRTRAVPCHRLQSYGYMVRGCDSPLSVIDLKSELRDEVVQAI